MTNEAETRQHTNRLIDETSPYLLQHAHNPVDWHPWDEEALERARSEGKPILLSIGYSACHWCHVMERESFEDDEVAALMNENFVNIKVDREERPDLDEIYMSAAVAMTGQGGWPLTVFLTPSQEPIFAGTYFPPEDAHGRPGFKRVLREIARAWREDRSNLKRRAEEFSDHLRRQRDLGPGLAVGEDELRNALEAFSDDFDPRHGGFGTEPKFPPSTGLSLLLRLHRRFDDEHALEMVRKTLDAMAAGGLYDQIGGGFARYSTDRRWLVPHFEKMLYDNALLTKVYLAAYQVTGQPSYRRVAEETLDWALREMRGEHGGFYSALDADSEGEEGRYYVWTPDQIAEVLEPEEARRFNAYYDIRPEGNWEGKSIPNRPRPLERVAKQLDIEPEDLARSLEESREKVLRARDGRVRPGTDDKVLTAWNGLMIGALAEAHRVLREDRYLEAAVEAAEFILETLIDDGGLLRTYRDGRAHLQAYLEDYAYLAEGLIDLYETSGTVRWLREAERLAERIVSDFADEETGAFFNTARDHEELLIRYRDGSDSATPAGNAVATSALARLSYHLDRADLRDAAAGAIKAYGRMIARHPRGFARSLSVVDFLLEGPLELAFVGRRGADDLEALFREVARFYLPNRIQAILDPDSDPDGAEGLPLLAGKSLVDGRAALYVCRDFACQAPITEPDQVGAALPADATIEGARRSIAVRMPGLATAEGTRRYADRFVDEGYTHLNGTELLTSRLGFGAYRTAEARPEHREALLNALTSGINLVDTSTNYMNGGSERLIGSVLRELIGDGELTRDEIIIVSKIGYLQADNLKAAREREKRDDPFPEVVKYEDELWHCIHPDFLADQIERSLDRLELESLDVLLLHNPEYFLSDVARRGDVTEATREEFYGRIAAAFEYLETRVAEGRIGAYGVSSNTVVASASRPDATSLTRFVDAARSAAGPDHTFRVLQLPLNLFEAGAVFERKEGPGGDRTVLELAAEEGIAVLANRPLNAVVNDGLLRLADPEIEKGRRVAFEEQRQKVADLEAAFRERIAPEIETPPGATDPKTFFGWAEQLARLRPHVQGVEGWSQIESQISYAVGNVVLALEGNLGGDTARRWSNWRDRYLEELDRLIGVVRREAAEHSKERARTVASAIDPVFPDRTSETLSRKALWTVASTPGVTSVLNGMRKPRYVEDAISVLAWPELEDPEAVYRAASGLSVEPDTD